MNNTTMPVPRQLRTAEQIREKYFAGTDIDARWVLKHCPRVQLSKSKVLFDEAAIEQWLAERSQPTGRA